MKISDVAIDRPVFTSMVFVAVLVMGGLALSRLGVDLFPDISFPLITVVTPYPGAGPEEVEAQVTRLVEESVSAINGVDEVRSYSRDSMSTVIVTFKLEADIRQASSDVRDKVAMIRGKLPRDVLDPVISRIDPTAGGVASYSVASARSSMETRHFVEKSLQPELESTDGVGSIVVEGGAVREIRVQIDRARMEANGLDVARVANALRAEGFDLPGGRIDVGPRELTVKTRGTFASPDAVGEVVLSASANGTQVRVKDVADIVDGTKVQRTLTRVNGEPAVTFMVQKQAGTNTVAVVDAIDKTLARMQKTLPPDVRINKVVDTSRFIKNNIDNLRHDLILGGLLAVLVIFVFMLDWRSTLISAVALPTSVIASFFVMWQLGFTLNIMTMMGLTMSIGMLIDDSVVVRENIFRHMERGEDPMTAARKGVDEIALAVFATTMTIVAVFVPVAFMGGLIGRMFRQFGLTVAAAVVVSLIVSFTLDPMLSARVTQKIDADHHVRMRAHWFFGPMTRFYDGMDSLYRDLLHWALSNRKKVGASAALLVIGSLFLVTLMGKEFFGRGDQGEFVVSIELPAGTSLSQTDSMTKSVEQLLKTLPEVKDLITVVGNQERVNKASVRVKVGPKQSRARSIEALMEDLRPKLAAIPGLVFSMVIPGIDGNAENAALAAPVALNLRGADFHELARLADEAYRIVQRTTGARDVQTTYRPGPPEQQFIVDRTLSADRGIAFAQVAGTLRTAIEGDVVGKYTIGEDTIDVRLQLRPEDRDSLDEIRRLAVVSMKGELVRLGDVTTMDEAATPATIERLDRQRQITITANVSGRSLGEVVADIEKQLAALEKPPGYSFFFSGESERMADTFTNMLLALGLAIVFIYLVLASQFESLLHPFTIMMALPLAIVGAFSALFLVNQPLGMPAMIGIILLMGLVTKNGILLVDYTNQLRAKGLGTMEALLEAGPTRLRPILMTSAAMVLGMLPAAVGTGDGSEFRVPQAVAVIGGVITSTLLTLVVVPVVYVWVDRYTSRGRAERRALRGPPIAPPAE